MYKNYSIGNFSFYNMLCNIFLKILYMDVSLYELYDFYVLF